MTIPAVRIIRAPSALVWHAMDAGVVAGEVSGRFRPDGRCFLYFDAWRPDVYRPLADEVAQELACDLYANLDDAEFDALDACAAAGFAEHRRESYYRIPTDPAVTGLSLTAMPIGLDVLSAAEADVDRLRILDDELRQDVPGCDGWRWDPGEFREDTFGPFFDPATYLVAVDRSSGEYAGLVRVWRSRGGPRLSLIGTLDAYRGRGVARALLGFAFAVVVARGESSVIAEADDADVVSAAWLKRLSARRYGGSVELIRRHSGVAISG